MTRALERAGWLAEAWDPFGIEGPAATLPAMNAWDDGSAFRVEMELPGFRREDVEVSVSGRDLLVSGKRGFEVPEGWTLHRRERAAGTFARRLSLPAPVDVEQVEAKLKDGILSLVLPKVAEARPRRIEVRHA
jgi:HSP20 family protein